MLKQVRNRRVVDGVAKRWARAVFACVRRKRGVRGQGSRGNLRVCVRRISRIKRQFN
jgi:hypothetical protein